MAHYNKYIVTYTLCHISVGSDDICTDKPIIVNGYIISNNYNVTLTTYEELATEARRDFPKLKDSDIECRTVLQSDWCKRCAAISFQLPPDPALTMKDYTNYKNRLPDIILS